MPDEKPFTPPTRKPVSEFPTPDPTVAFYTELVNRDDPAYYSNAPMKRGQLYSTIVGAKKEVIAQYPNLFFLVEKKFQLDDQKVLWYWATDENAHDTYNSTVTYVQNAINYPSFTRTYTVRRELYEADPTVPIGSPLPGIIAVEITSPGKNHTEARGVIDGTSVDITFTVSPTGELLNGIITNTGEELIQDGTPITIIGDGQDSSAIARAQPVGCVLTSQTKKEQDDSDPLQHELVEVIRVYETLPGPWITTTEMDKDGMIVTSKTRRQIKDFITDKDQILNGEWIQTFHKDTDDFVAEETVSSRPVPGNPIVNTKVEEDGMVTTITKTLVDASTVVSSETLIGGVWTRTYKTEVDESSLIKVHQASNLVAWKMVEARPIPGNPVPSTKLDDDGVKVDVVKTLKDTTSIVTQETLSGGIWTRKEKQAVSDLVAQEIVTARVVPGNVVPSVNIGSDQEIATISRRLKDTTLITPSTTEGGGVITTVEKKEVTDLVSEEINTQKPWLDEAFYSISIINLIPREFMANIPTKVVSHILAGTASQPTIGFQEFEHSRKQLTKLLYEERITTIDAPGLPITHTNTETTEIYGGGVINVNYVLDLLGAQAIDQGLLVISSSLTDLGNGMVVKETRVLPDPAWPILQGTDLDEVHLATLPYTKQTVAAGSTGGIVGSVYTQVRPIDTWRSDSVATTVPSDLSSLNRDYATVVNHAFPDTLIDATLDYASVSTNGFTVFDFGLSYTLVRGYRGACDGHIYEVYTNGPPSGLPTVTKFFPQSHMRTISGYSACAASGESCSGRSFARVWEFEFPMSLHDAITVTNSGNTMSIPATTPTALPASGTEITIDIQTERWKYGIYITKIINVIMP